METQAQFFRTVFIFNPRSGSVGNKRGLIRLIDRIWGEAGRRYSILVTTRAGEGERLARDEVSRGADLIVAVGGDGTLNEVVRGVLGTQACVGLMPAGSGNGFARHFGIPLNLAAACWGLMNPRIVRCDAGMAGDRLFIVTFGCGIDASISDRYQHSTMRGMLSYFYHGAQAFRDYRRIETQVRTNGEIVYSGQPLLLTLANVRGYGGGTIIAPQARTDDGLLDLVAVDGLSLKNSLLHLRELFNGSIHQIPGYHHAQIREAVIERAEKGAIHVDGDPYPGDREIRIRVLPQILPLALPHESQAKEIQIQAK
jgi:YegS/Rv2252/BmrU family lipid kinase